MPYIKDYPVVLGSSLTSVQRRANVMALKQALLDAANSNKPLYIDERLEVLLQASGDAQTGDTGDLWKDKNGTWRLSTFRLPPKVSIIGTPHAEIAFGQEVPEGIAEGFYIDHVGQPVDIHVRDLKLSWSDTPGADMVQQWAMIKHQGVTPADARGSHPGLLRLDRVTLSGKHRNGIASNEGDLFTYLVDCDVSAAVLGTGFWGIFNPEKQLWVLNTHFRDAGRTWEHACHLYVSPTVSLKVDRSLFGRTNRCGAYINGTSQNPAKYVQILNSVFTDKCFEGIETNRNAHTLISNCTILSPSRSIMVANSTSVLGCYIKGGGIETYSVWGTEPAIVKVQNNVLTNSRVRVSRDPSNPSNIVRGRWTIESNDFTIDDFDVTKSDPRGVGVDVDTPTNVKIFNNDFHCKKFDSVVKVSDGSVEVRENRAFVDVPPVASNYFLSVNGSAGKAPKVKAVRNAMGGLALRLANVQSGSVTMEESSGYMTPRTFAIWGDGVQKIYVGKGEHPTVQQPGFSLSGLDFGHDTYRLGGSGILGKIEFGLAGSDMPKQATGKVTLILQSVRSFTASGGNLVPKNEDPRPVASRVTFQHEPADGKWYEI